MKRARSVQPAASAAFVALSVLISIGAAAEGSTAPRWTSAHAQQHVLTQAERKTLATLICSLSEAAKQLRPHNQAAHASLLAHRPSSPAAGARLARLRLPDRDEPLHPLLIARPGLINLPPPIAA
ncbi:MAG: hypothetical protein ACLFV3_10615 [Phycisphaeraceae bacterium]